MKQKVVRNIAAMAVALVVTVSGVVSGWGAGKDIVGGGGGENTVDFFLPPIHGD